MIWFTSDTHFSHERIITLCNRPFRDAQHMNEMLIKNWNDVVSPDDTVFHLGDVALGTFSESILNVGRLNGFKILVDGNHDRLSVEKASRRERFEPMYREVFQEIAGVSASVILDIGEIASMSHYPYEGDHTEKDRHGELRLVDYGHTLLHGHTHSTEKVSRSKRGTLMIHVGVDAWDYRPVSMDEVCELVQRPGV